MTENQVRLTHTSSTAPRRVSMLWAFLPGGARLLMWWMMREHRKAARQYWTSHFPLLTTASCKRVAKVLRDEWDHTGVRLLGIPKSDYLDFAKRIIVSIHAPIGSDLRELPPQHLI